MYKTSKKTCKCGAKMHRKFHDGIWFGLKIKSDDSIIVTPSGVIKAKTEARNRQTTTRGSKMAC